MAGGVIESKWLHATDPNGFSSMAGKLRVGSSDDPSEKLHIDGAIRIADTTINTTGTIRWTGVDFEGYMLS